MSEQHIRECAELAQDLKAIAAEFEIKVEKLAGGNHAEALEIWRHAFRQAFVHADNPMAVEYAQAACAELVAEIRSPNNLLGEKK